ncbi:MAG: tetratricopeptide repeat protein [Spirochaetaceae bacterium]
MRRITPVAFVVFTLLALAVEAPAQDDDDANDDATAELFEEGRTRFGSGEYERALETFQELPPSPDAYFWIGRSAMAAGELTVAEENFDRLLEEHPDYRRAPEARYHRGRLFYLQSDYAAAIEALEQFVREHPDSAYLANAYYWVGESLYQLGHFDRAAELFRTVTEDYPDSFRAEAADYRLSVIELARREESLLKLLRWSHEEYLNALEEFERREKSYEEAISEYRERLRRLARDDFRAEIDRLSDRVAELEDELAERDRVIRDLRQRLSARSGGPAEPAGETDARLVEAKARALELKEFYLDRLLGEAQEER